MWQYRPLAKRQRAYEEEWFEEEPHRTITVHETDDSPIQTGLVDANGTPLYRTKVRVPIGFVGNGGS